MKSFVWLAFVLAVLLQWAAPLGRIWEREQIIKGGQLVRMRCGAPDPYDLLRGRYLRVSLQPATGKAAEGAKITYDAPVFVMLKEGADGLAEIAEVRAEEPSSGLYIAARAGWVNDSDKSVSITWPVDRYYLNEKLAPEADKWFAKNVRSDKPVVAEMRVKNGQPVLTALTHEGKSLRDLLKAAK